MDPRDYRVLLSAKVRVHDEGLVEVESYLGELGAKVELDSDTHPPEQIAEDAARVRDALLASPSYHYINITMQP